MAGLLDYLSDPSNAGMMDVALGLLSAGGPSTRPVSLGQAIGAAGKSGMQTYRQAKADQASEQQNQMQMLMQQMQFADVARKMQTRQGAEEAIRSMGPRAQQAYALTGDASKALEVEQQDQFMNMVKPAMGGQQVAAPRPYQGRVSGNFQINTPDDVTRLSADLQKLEATNPQEAAAVRESLIQQGLIKPASMTTGPNPGALAQLGATGSLMGIKGAPELLKYADFQRPELANMDTGSANILYDKRGGGVSQVVPKGMTPEGYATNERELAKMRHEGISTGGSGAGTATGGGGMLSPKQSQETQFEMGKLLNETWVKKSLTPALEAGDAAETRLQTIRALKGVDLKTGWGTETKAAAASILEGLGVASPAAKMYATNAQIFQTQAMDNLFKLLGDQKGPQTEGDADRAKQTFASLKNTPAANQYILDLAEAKANRDKIKAQFYQDGLEIAKQTGDYSGLDRAWKKATRSIFDDPVMQKYKAAR